MTTVQLTEQQIHQISQLPDVNTRKTGYQTIVVDLFSNVRRLLFEGFTRCGKTYMALQTFTRYRAKGFTKPLVVIVPNELIKSEWEKAVGHIDNLHIYIINTYTMSAKPHIIRNCGILVVDEAHWALGKDSKYFSQVMSITNTDFLLLLTATVTKEQKEFAERYSVLVRFVLPLKVGFRLGVVPAYYSINIPVQFTEAEKLTYIQLQEEFASYVNWVTPVDEDNPTELLSKCLKGKKIINYKGREGTGNQLADWIAVKLSKHSGVKITGGQVIGQAIKWQAVINKRRELLMASENKMLVMQHLLRQLQNMKALIFCSRVKHGNALTKLDKQAVVYSYEQNDIAKKKAKDAFYSGVKPHLISCKSLQEGLTVFDVRVGINMGFTAQAREIIQKLGRLLQFDEDDPTKESVMLNVFVDDFVLEMDKVNGIVKRISSQEKKWLKTAQFDMSFVLWVKHVGEIDWDRIRLSPR